MYGNNRFSHLFLILGTSLVFVPGFRIGPRRETNAKDVSGISKHLINVFRAIKKGTPQGYPYSELVYIIKKSGYVLSVN